MYTLVMRTTNDVKRSRMIRYASRLKKRMTGPELAFELRLKSMGLRYMKQKCFFIGNTFRIVDFYLPKPYKLALEIDGGCHCETIAFDRFKDKMLLKRGIKTIRISNDLVDSFDFSSLPIL